MLLLLSVLLTSELTALVSPHIQAFLLFLHHYLIHRDLYEVTKKQ
jgi:hypothetical protein